VPLCANSAALCATNNYTEPHGDQRRDTERKNEIMVENGVCASGIFGIIIIV